MEHCHKCQRQLTTARSVIEIDGVRYCSDACRQGHRGKTAQEQRQERRAQKRFAMGKSFPLLMFGGLFLFGPLLFLLYAAVVMQYFRPYDVIGLLPGAVIFGIGVYTYKEHAPRSRHK